MNESKTNIFDNNGDAIDLLHIFGVLWRKLWLIVLCGILAAAACFCWSAFLITPQYSSTVLMYVNNGSISVGSTSINLSDLSAAKSLVNTYLVILRNRTTMNEIIDKTGVDYTYEELLERVSAEAVNDTEIFGITVTTDDPYKSEKIANSIATILPNRVADIIDGSSMRMVDQAVADTEKSSPSITKYTLVGLILGLIISSAAVIISDLLDDVIRDENYVLQTYNIPILAVVPDLLSEGSKRYGYYNGY